MKITKQAIKTKHCSLFPPSFPQKQNKKKSAKTKEKEQAIPGDDLLLQWMRSTRWYTLEISMSRICCVKMPTTPVYLSVRLGNSYPSDPQPCATAEWGIFLAARRLCFANATFATRTGYKLGGCQPCYWDTDSLKSATTLILMCITVPWMPQTAMFKMYLTVL